MLMARKRTGDTLFNTATAFFLGVAIVLSLIPFLWMIMNCFKTTDQIFQNPIQLPRAFDISVFRAAWEQANFTVAFKNSIISTVSTVGAILLFSSWAAFPLARMTFRGSTFVLRFFIASIIISGQVIIIPLFYFMTKLGFYNSLLSIILVNTTFGLPLSVYLFWGFFKEIPVEVEESTQIDGCPHRRFFWSFLLPLSRPIIATVLIFNALWTWNEYLFSLTFLKVESVMTIPLKLQRFFTTFKVQWQFLFAALTIAVLPVVILYLALQRSFIKGLTAGAVKL